LRAARKEVGVPEGEEQGRKQAGSVLNTRQWDLSGITAASGDAVVHA
jgi:hypothetical protein